MLAVFTSTEGAKIQDNANFGDLVRSASNARNGAGLTSAAGATA